MDPITLVAGAALVRFIISKSKQSPKDTQPVSVQRTTNSIKPLKKVITFIGATSSGKSSTINALIGYSALKVGASHGTTLEFNEVDYICDYKLRDTPGLLDSIDFSNSILSSIEDSELVVYVAKGQLYRPELEIVKRIWENQILWSQPGSISRNLCLYVNKQDVSKATMDRATFDRERLAVIEQVSRWIPKSMISFGSSSPISQGTRQSAKIEELQQVILGHISQNT